MGLVIDLGLSRFYKPDDAQWPAALNAVVASGMTAVVRDVVGARVYEARRVGREVEGRWLPADEAKPIFDELAELQEVGASASFSWNELEELGVEPQTLELVFDERPSPLSTMDTIRNTQRLGGYEIISLPGSLEVKVGDLRKSADQWDDWDDMSNLVCAIQRIAIRHRMIVHNE